jgi:hypothetical protein
LKSKARPIGDYAQGYFISKPVGPNEFFALATSRDEGRRIA